MQPTPSKAFGDLFLPMKTIFLIALIKLIRTSASSLDKGYTTLGGFDALVNH